MRQGVCQKNYILFLTRKGKKRKKKDLSKENCGLEKCPILAGFWIRYAGEVGDAKAEKIIKECYKSGERVLRYYGKKEAQ